jgi:DNA-binding LacI/PurR family transcriptional regulator
MQWKRVDLVPPPTTIAQPKEELARIVHSLLTGRVKGKNKDTDPVFPLKGKQIIQQATA